MGAERPPVRGTLGYLAPPRVGADTTAKVVELPRLHREVHGLPCKHREGPLEQLRAAAVPCSDDQTGLPVLSLTEVKAPRPLRGCPRHGPLRVSKPLPNKS